jgi:hypothetical protein
MPATRVTVGLACLGGALLIGVAILLSAWREPRLAIVCFVIIGGLIWLAARRSWARVALIVLTVLSLVVNVYFGFLPFQLQYGGVISIATGIQIVLEIVGCGLLLARSRTRPSDG